MEGVLESASNYFLKEIRRTSKLKSQSNPVRRINLKEIQNLVSHVQIRKQVTISQLIR
jgi:hypothetical protein